MNFKINLEMVQRIINYLAEFPYKDVYDIIDNLKEQAKKSSINPAMEENDKKQQKSGWLNDKII